MRLVVEECFDVVGSISGMNVQLSLAGQALMNEAGSGNLRLDGIRSFVHVAEADVHLMNVYAYARKGRTCEKHYSYDPQPGRFDWVLRS